MLACESGEYTNHGETKVEELLDQRDDDGAALYDVNGTCTNNPFIRVGWNVSL